MIDLIDITNFIQDEHQKYIIDNKFVDDINYNFTDIETELNDHLARIVILEVHTTMHFQSQVLTTNVFVDDDSTTVVGSTSKAAGTYIKTTSLPFIDIDTISDSLLHVKMLKTERDFVRELQDQFVSAFRLQVGERGPVFNERIRLTAGPTFNLYTISGSDGIPEIRIESLIPNQYFKLNQYDVEPTRPDPTNRYRFRINSGPYVLNTLRVYINTHRIPSSSIVQDPYFQLGEFYFENTVPLEDLPNQNDIIYCDFDVPINLGPEDTGGELGTWWGPIYTHSDGASTEPDVPSKTLRYYPSYGSFNTTNAFEIRASNPYVLGTEIPGIDTVYFFINESQIDHNALKNYETGQHHALRADDQNLWSGIKHDTNTATPNSTSTLLTLTSADNSVAIVVDNSAKTIDFQVDLSDTVVLSLQTSAASVYSGITLYTDQTFVVGNFVGFADQAAAAGKLRKIDVRPVDASGDGSVLHILGIVMEIDVNGDSNYVTVATKGLISETILAGISGKDGINFAIHDTTLGAIGEEGTGAVPADLSDLYYLEVGTVINNNGTNYLHLYFKDPILKQS